MYYYCCAVHLLFDEQRIAEYIHVNTKTVCNTAAFAAVTGQLVSCDMVYYDRS